MRMIVILAATSITFVVTLPLSIDANALTRRECSELYKKCVDFYYTPPPPNTYIDVNDRLLRSQAEGWCEGHYLPCFRNAQEEIDQKRFA